MEYVKELDALYTYLYDVLELPNDLTDILRAEWVQAVSAMDKLIHELVRIGMVEAFQGSRVRTSKFMNFTISMNTYSSITVSSISPPEYWFEQEVIQRNKYLSFQEPDKIADGLSLIWDEQHKWQALSAKMGIPQKDLTTRLKTIIARRNQIVHEADLDLATGERNGITKADADFVVQFIEQLSTEIFDAVK